MKIIVYKSRRQLTCLCGEKIILETPVQLGFGCNDGSKLREGDGRTPEGRYFVSSKNPASKFHLALGISYPNPDDACRGFAAGIIDELCLNAIVSSPLRPPWHTPLGGFIMIHGQPNDGPREGDWTAGCIALPNDIMEELFSMAAIGDEVVILP